MHFCMQALCARASVSVCMGTRKHFVHRYLAHFYMQALCAHAGCKHEIKGGRNK